MKSFLLFMMVSALTHTSGEEGPDLTAFGHNKQIPDLIRNNVLKALSFYPELKQAPIDFIFKPHIRSSIMQAQPVFRTLLRKRKNRSYRINISTHFRLTHSLMPIQQIPDEVMIGWIGHELGHIMDYESKSNPEIISFGCNYYLSSNYVKKAEIVADTYAVNHGLGSFLIATKRFILDHAELPQAYKNKIARLYLSPDVIVEQVRKLEEKKQQAGLR